MEFEIKYSFKKDSKNYINSVYQFSYFLHGRKNIKNKLLQNIDIAAQEIIVKSENKEFAYNKIYEYLKERYNRDKFEIVNSIKNLRNILDNSKKLIINKLENLYKNKVVFEKVTIYLTTIPVCPHNYKEKYFFVYLLEKPSIQSNIVLHELNHFMFYFYYSHLLSKLGMEKFELLKESLTFFTNPEQKGKPNEKELRDFFSGRKWESIDSAIKEAVKFLPEL